MNNTFIGISYLQTASIRFSLRRFARLLKLQSFYRKSGQMAKPGKVWHILAMNRSQNVVFYSPINYSSRGEGCIPHREGCTFRGCIFARGYTPEGGAFAPPLGRLSSELSFFYSESHSTKNQQAKAVAHRCHIPHILVYAKCPCKPDKTKNSINQRNDLHALSFFSI